MLSARDGCEAVVYSTKVVLSSSHGGKGLDPMFTHYPILSSSCGSRLLSSCAVWAELQGPSQASVHHQNLLQHARTSMALTITSPPPGQKKGRAPAPLLLRDTMLGFFFFFSTWCFWKHFNQHYLIQTHKSLTQGGLSINHILSNRKGNL